MSRAWATLIAAALAVVIFQITLSSGFYREFLVASPLDTSQIELKFAPIDSKYISNLSNSLQSELDLRVALADPKVLTIFGSSELTGRDTLGVRPVTFIPRHSRLKVFALGHAGNQSLAIWHELLSNYDILDQSKVLILVSPSWFYGSYAEGTSVASFFDYSTPRSRWKILTSGIVPPKYIGYLGQYVYSHSDDIEKPDESLLILKTQLTGTKRSIKRKIGAYPIEMARRVWYTCFHLYDDPLYEFKSRLDSLHASQVIDYKFDQGLNKSGINWGELFTQASAYQRSKSSNNGWGIYNDYYSKYVQNKEFIIKPVSDSENRELEDFKMLIDLLSYYHVDATFVIQTLNPYAYSNLKDGARLVDDLDSIITTSGFPVLNMFVTDTSKYQIGVLADAMHLGDLGWYQIDKFIFDQYINE